MRTLGSPRTRRGVEAALLAGLLGPVVPAAEAKGSRGKARGDGARRRRKVRAEQLPSGCCSTGNCTPGKGKNLSKCCYGDGNVSGKNFSGANLGSVNFTRADASDANFSGANLGKACLIDADLTGATLNGSTNTGGAIFCRTTMPNGTTNDSGCSKGTTCCSTCIAEGQARGAGIGGTCCVGTTCLGGVCAVCPSGCPFDTLGPAVDAADDGGTIRICSGTYRTLDVLIFKDVTIVGAGAASSSLSAARSICDTALSRTTWPPATPPGAAFTTFPERSPWTRAAWRGTTPARMAAASSTTLTTP